MHAPVDGRSYPIEHVPDEAFAQKMLGDGFAVTPDSEYICAPCSGKLVQIFPTNHAFGIMTEDGLEILVHIGVDTIHLQGKGFTRITEMDTDVKVGDQIVKVDLAYLKGQGVNTDVIVMVTNMDKVYEMKTSIGKYSIGDKVSQIVLS